MDERDLQSDHNAEPVIDDSIGVEAAQHEDTPTPPSAATSTIEAPPPATRRRRRNNLGCWFAGFFGLCAALALVAVAVFLPPFNLYDRLFGVQYVMLDAANNAIRSDDNNLTLVLSPDDTGRDFGIALQTVPLNSFASASAATAEWIPAARAALPSYLALQSSVYTIQTTGDEPESIAIDFRLPANLTSGGMVDLYGWDVETGRWSFIPSQPSDPAGSRVAATIGGVPEQIALFAANPTTPIVQVIVDITQELTPEAAQLATVVSPAGLQPSIDGRVLGSLAPGFDTNTRSYRVMPVIRNFTDPRALDPDTVTVVISSEAARAAHIREITAVVSNGGFQGVVIDYRDLPIEQRDNFTTFIRELGAALHAADFQLSVVVPAAENIEGRWETGAYDWRMLGTYADTLQIDFTLDPVTFAQGEDRLIEAMLRWAVGEVSRYKLLGGLTARSVREVGGDFTTIGYNDALNDLGNVQIDAPQTPDGVIAPGKTITASLDGLEAVPGLDTTIITPFIEYVGEDGTTLSKVWLTTGDALRYRIDRVTDFAMGGVALYDLTAPDIAGDVLAAVSAFRLGQNPPFTQRELALRWTIEDAAGVVDEIVTGLNEDLVVTAQAVQGNYAFNVEIVDGASSVARSGAGVSIFQPTPTPPDRSTPTPTIEPTTTPTLVAIVPTVPAPTGLPDFQFAAVPPGAGAIVSGFEYGGHVASTNSGTTINAMRQAGMTWMKVQARFNPGCNLDNAANYIREAKSHNFKILVGFVGNPNNLRDRGAEYVREFASCAGQLAALGPDAIEVWNEPNISREWPAGQISAANYVNMLGQAYNAIKANNPNVMVISAAPAPTGGEAAYPAGTVVNDNRFIAEMFASGAAQYMDCMGVHYNEGIVPPEQQNGDPRGDDYYTRFFWGMVNTYWNASGGAKPLCFTELGYLSSQGYGSLPDAFAWAANVTTDQQAAWLASAIAQASGSGKVRLVIVWNVDFQRYDGNDPMAGYAMIRPGGGCPACGAIAGAR